MIVIDLNGCPIEVMDLKDAIKMAGQFKKYLHENQSFSEFDKKLVAYWADIYEKLKAIKTEQYEQPRKENRI